MQLTACQVHALGRSPPECRTSPSGLLSRAPESPGRQAAACRLAPALHQLIRRCGHAKVMRIQYASTYFAPPGESCNRAKRVCNIRLVRLLRPRQPQPDICAKDPVGLARSMSKGLPSASIICCSGRWDESIITERWGLIAVSVLKHRWCRSLP